MTRKVTVSATAFQGCPGEYGDMAALDKTTVVVTSHGRERYALVPMEALRELEDLRRDRDEMRGR